MPVSKKAIKEKKTYSGVTIGFGYDLRYYAPEEIERDWGAYLPAETVSRLKQASGIRGLDAQIMKDQMQDIFIPREVALSVFMDKMLQPQIKKTLSLYPEAANLPPDSLGALVSMVFNRGELLNSSDKEKNKELAEKRMIQTALRNGDHDEIPALLSAMKQWMGDDANKVRRDEEAKLFREGLKGSR